MQLMNQARSVLRLATLVRERPAFVARSVRRRPEIARYHLAGTDVAFHLRHATPDSNTLEQVVGQGHYDLPAGVEAALAGAQGPLKIVDLGSNIGLFSALMLARFPDAHLVAYEPDPDNAAVLRRSTEANAPRYRWELREAAAGVQDGTVRFRAGGFAVSRVADDGEGGVEVAVRDVYADLERVDFLKIDIEGAEWALVADPRFATIPARVVAFEYHPHGAPGDARAAAEAALRGAGFEVGDGHLDAAPGHGMVWGWKSSSA